MRKLAASAAIIFASSLLFAAPIAAATGNYTVAQRHQVLIAFAQCIYNEEREAALDYALGVKGARREKLGSFKCASRSVGRDFFKLRVPNEVMVGGLAEVVLTKVDLSSIDSAIAASPLPPLAKQLTKDDFDPNSREVRARWEANLPVVNAELQMLAAVDCTVHKSPTQARAVFAAPFGSNQESQAISALVPVLGQCLPGKELRLRPDTLRSALAMRYLKMANRVVPEFRKKLV